MTFINPRAKVLRHIDRVVDWRRGDRPGPVTVEWDLSNVCSLGCQSCHFAHTHVAGPWASMQRDKPADYSSTGKFADLFVVARAMREMRDAGVRSIVWSGGGEPTLYPSFATVIAEAYTHGFEQGLYTLGGHITPELATAIRGSLSWVVVSLDAADAETYAAEKNVPASRFDNAIDGILRLAGGGSCAVGVSFLLHAGNWTKTGPMLALSRSLGATYTTFRPTIETSPANPSVCDASREWVSWAEATLRELEAEPDVEIDVARFHAYRDWQGHGYQSCKGIQLVTTISPDGRVWVCPNRRGVPGSELGDLRKESFAAIWARHPGQFAVDGGCRVMCRLHPVNQQLAQMAERVPHEAFV